MNSRVSKLSLGQGKSLNIWPRKKQYYRVPTVCDQVSVNPRVAQLSFSKNIASTISFFFSSSEALALDRALAELVQAQSFSFWLLSSFFAFLDHEDFSPSNTSLYQQFTAVLSAVTQTQASWSLSVQAFITLIKRKSVLSKLLPSVLPHQKEELLRSPCFSDNLFDQGVLERVIAEHSQSQQQHSTQQMAKFFSSAALSKAPSFTFQRGSRRPFSRPFYSTRGRGGKGGRGK